MLSRTSRAFVAFCIAALLASPFFVYSVTHIASFEAGFFHAGQDILAGKPYGYLGAYPPGIPLLFAGIMKVVPSLSVKGAILIHLSLFALGAAIWWLCIEFCLSSRKWQIITWTFSLINPYLLWTALTSKDTAFEWFILSTFFTCLVAVLHPSTRTIPHLISLTTAASAAIAHGVWTRVSVVPIIALGLLTGFVIGPRARRASLGAMMGVLILTTGSFVLWQSRGSGYTGLSSTIGINTYYGQHPLYEAIHPAYDIDVFLEANVPGTTLSAYSAEGSRRLLTLGREAIIHSPSTFIVRALRKTVWHWLNIEKVPALTSATRLVESDGNMLTIKYQSPNQIPGAVYIVYKLLYLPVFLFTIILSCLTIVRRRALKGHWHTVLLTPLFALWPVAVLTFPDTRFKIVAEALAVLFMAIELQNHAAALRAFAPNANQNDNR